MYVYFENCLQNDFDAKYNKLINSEIAYDVQCFHIVGPEMLWNQTAVYLGRNGRSQLWFGILCNEYTDIWNSLDFAGEKSVPIIIQ